MATENNQNQCTNPSPMDPFVNFEKCQHRLVPAKISSLDKCVQCEGSVCSLKWLGYKCRVCSGSDIYPASDELQVVISNTHHKLPVPTTQLAKISKLFLSMEKRRLSSMQGKSLDEIEIEDEIGLSRDEVSESESDESSTEVTALTSGTVKLVDAESTITEKVHDETDFAGTLSSVSSTVNETAPPSEGTNAGQEHGSRSVPKRPWSKAEEAAVMRHFKDHIIKGRLATKTKCSHCKLVEGPVLAQGNVQNIRDFVRNTGVAAKRQSKKSSPICN
ncbi:uncharacterized protein ACBT44_016777 [Syngnathus typhle]